MKQLYIHIGTGKTGTSAIQEFLYNNRKELLSDGVRYVDAGIVKNNHH